MSIMIRFFSSTLWLTLVCATGLCFRLMTGYLSYNKALDERTARRIVHIHEYFEKIDQNNRFPRLINNQWRSIDNATTGNFTELIDIIRPFQQHLNHGLITIYDKNGNVAARVDKPDVFGDKDALTPWILWSKKISTGFRGWYNPL